MTRILNLLDPVVESYGGLDPHLLVDVVSEEIEISHDRIEAVIREEAGKRSIPLLPA
ncbi:hypothetical protein [Aurantimonas sp. HBX-1]|uniref:hypothetical protein n=1 Tax=Aurantimonas sp. HBX-1 TaxID=2906072 RepID=UPI001F254579|nr:hypothetical protein [Aurantimonas sp. HBX-1]UIJ73356.1 hypothetical protein LXB15_06880 [Aurantimonas sp. HBX-1]